MAGPESFILGAVQSLKLRPLQGKNIAEIAKLWNKDPIEDGAFTSVAFFLMAEPDVALALQQPWVSICNDSQGASPEGLLGTQHPSACIWYFSPDSAQVCPGRKEANPGRSDPKIHGAPRATHAFCESGFPEIRNVGRCRGFRPGCTEPLV